MEAVAAASMAKLHVSECFMQNSLDAVRIFGASGYSGRPGSSAISATASAAWIFSGTNDIQRNIIAQQLRLG